MGNGDLQSILIPDKKRGVSHANGSSGKRRVGTRRQMVACIGCQRHRKKRSCDAASAQYRAGRRDRQARQLRRTHLEQPDQIQIRGRALPGQFQTRNHLGRVLLQGFRQPARKARSRAGAAAGARSATIVTSGFSELQDDDSQRLAAELQQAIRETGLAVTGPNCLGNLSAGEKLFTNIDDRIVTMEAGPVAIAGQSGAIVMAIRQALEDRGVGVGYMVTTGNEAGLETPDLMAYFAADPSIRVIVVYLEGVRNTKAFRDACKAARAAGKPVIALKLGASEGGRAAAMAHTGALAGSIETFDAISTREGVIRVRGLDELIETTECFVHADPPKGNRLAAVSLSGGKRGLLIDAFHAAGLNFAPLSQNADRKSVV